MGRAECFNEPEFCTDTNLHCAVEDQVFRVQKTSQPEQVLVDDRHALGSACVVPQSVGKAHADVDIIVRTLYVCGGMDDHANLVREIWPWAQSVIMHGFARPMNGARPDSTHRGKRIWHVNVSPNAVLHDFALQWDG